MVRTQIQLTEKQAREIKRLAAEKNVSIAELIRQSVELLLKSPSLMDREGQTARAKAAAEKHRSDRTDVSRNHDSYLEEVYSE